MGLLNINIIIAFYIHLLAPGQLAYTLGEFPSIRPIPCQNRMTGESGVCTFNWSCQNVAHGVHIGNCVDRFFVGTCCKIPETGGFGGSHSIPSTITEKSQTGTETSTKTPKDSIQMEPLSEIITTKVRPTEETEEMPIPLKSNLNPNNDLSNHHDKLDVSTSYTEISASSLKRKPVLLDILTSVSSFDSSDFLYNKHSFTELEKYNFSTFPTKLLSSSTIKNNDFHPTHVPLSDSSTFLSTEYEVTTESQNHGEPFQGLITTQNYFGDFFNSFIENNIKKQWNTSSEIDDSTLSFVFKDNVEDLYQTETNLHKEKLPGDTFNSFAYNILSNESKNTTSNETETPAAIDLNSDAFSSSDTSSSSNPSHLYFSTSQDENTANINLSLSIANDYLSTPGASTIDVLLQLENAATTNKVPTNIKNFTEPKYPWPSSITTENPAKNVSQGVIFHDVKNVCGRSRSNMMARIVGGRRSHLLKWPWMISLRRFEGKSFKHKCGAALLNQFWAITAAHCVDGKLSRDVILRLGEFNFHRKDDTHPHIERRIYMIVIHPNFDPTTYENDLALLRFYEPVQLQANIVPVCLPHSTEEIEGKTGIVTGWGRLSEEGELPGLLHEVHMPIITNKECEDMYSQAGYPETIRDVFVCAGVVNGGLDACEGDSGGPMVVKGNHGQYVLVGLISWGMGCAAPKQPGVYTRITKFVDWIDGITLY